MATANLGRVGFVNKGTYSGATAYKVNDVVVYNSGTYACIQANTGQAPTNTSYWQNWVADNAVHKTGDETISGVKTFGSNTVHNGDISVKGALQSYSANNAICLSQEGNIGTITATRTSGNYSSIDIKTAGANSAGIPTARVNINTEGTVSISTSGQGLKLPNASSTDATTLDWYEEGTFTPTIVGTTTAGTGTYSVNKGKFTRIGNKVHIEVGITVTAHTGTGSMRITGIPFTISADSGYAATSLVDYANLTITGIPYAVAAPGASSIWLIAMGTSGGTPAGLAMDASFVLAFSMTYSV